MQKIDLDPRFFQGAVSFQQTRVTIRPWRLLFNELDIMMPAQAGLIDRARETAGVRLRFETDSRVIVLEFEPLGPLSVNPVHKMDLTIGADVIQTVSLEAGATAARFDRIPAGRKVVEIWLPQDTGVSITALRIDDGATCDLAADTRPRWITYGSSLTHCHRAHSPARTWPAIVARRAGLNLLCLGYGGNCCLEPVLGLMIRDLPADLITLKLGINCIGGALAPRTFGPAVMGLVRTIREKHSHTPLGLISPIAYPPHETEPNVVGNTITMMRDDITEAAVRLRKRGDRRLADFSGLDIFNEEEIARYTADRCHPNGDGIELMAEHFLESVLPGMPAGEKFRPEKKYPA